MREGDSERFKDSLRAIAADNFDAVVIRPEYFGILSEMSTELADFIEYAHSIDLRVIVRIPGVSARELAAGHFDIEDGISTILGRVRAALAAHADGVDLGPLDLLEPYESPVAQARLRRRIARLSGNLLAELEEYNHDPILVASASVWDVDVVREHIHEDWFHHLKDAALINAPWQSAAIVEAIRISLDLHDPLGAVTPWIWTKAHMEGTEGHPHSWENTADTSRHTAMELLALSLPGATYVSSPAPTVEHPHVSPVREALRIRRSYDMGRGSLGVVSGLEWANSDVAVLLCGGVMVVLNTGETDVHVPREHSFLVSSMPVVTAADGDSIVPPQTCAWYETARVQPEHMPIGG